MTKNILLSILAIIVLFFACQDVISVDLEEAEPQLVIDAWLNDKQENQVIKLRQTSNYFDNTFLNPVLGATVQVTDNDGNVFDFVDVNSNGDYILEVSTSNEFAVVGKTYNLNIEVDGLTYSASTIVDPTTQVDSISYTKGEAPLDGLPDGVYAEFYARDLIGLGNTYWIKTFKNGQFLNKPSEINIAYDSSVNNAGIDGIIFIFPIRFSVNRVEDSGDEATDTSDLPPYAEGDSIRVEIHSISEEAFYFLTEAQIQMTLGDNTIFAPPVSNVPSNIISPSTLPNEQKALGFFCVSAVSELGIRVE